jgi:hypothetical protein
MHPHTIDWLRNVEINVDAALAEKRWKVATDFAAALEKSVALDLIRLFLFTKPDAALVSSLTEKFLKFDAEFPVSSNLEKVRVMAGLVIATTLNGNSKYGDFFSLGIRAARLRGLRGQPAVGGIVEEVEGYLLREAADRRPDDFAPESAALLDSISKKYDILQEAEAGGNVDKLKEAQLSYHAAVIDRKLGRRVRQLAEELQLLWWVIGEYSPFLERPVALLSASKYAMVAAAEAAVRVKITPPPPAIDALLLRALKPCKGSRKKVILSELLNETDASWRARQVAAKKIDDRHGLFPLSTALEKMQELSDGTHAMQVVSKICPGIKADLSLTQADTARQYFAELSFLAALERV